MAWLRFVSLLIAAAPVAAQAPVPGTHLRPPLVFGGATADQSTWLADAGAQIEHDRDPAWSLAEHRRLAAALAALRPQRKGTVDAYVIVAGLDSDAVFGREAREAARVLARRYDAVGRTILLAGDDARGGAPAPRGSPDNLATALARVAETMDRREDVLVLYTTSHGAPWGLFYNDADTGAGAISPARLAGMLSGLGIANRLLLISACYSGVFVSALQSDTTALVTAASADRTSFGCQADSDWTFFGDAMINHALRTPQPFGGAAIEAIGLVAEWERSGKLTPSQPQIVIGAGVDRWLSALEARMPTDATPTVGRPAITMLGAAPVP